MKKNLLIISGAFAAVLVIASCVNSVPAVKETAIVSKDSLIKRGSYLVTIMGCNDCHTPMKMGPKGPERDMDRMLSGHPDYIPISKFDTTTTKNWVLFGMSGTAIVGPWGTSFAGNLTSDATGIGNWTEEQFKKALKQGKFKGLDGNRTILPPMPWENYVNIKDEDITAIFTFLKSTNPVKNIVPAPISPDKLTAYTR
ncbi:MAG: putative lipoprotein [Chitinophagaceae bacterium]|nr:putative lipoprotein [Chitinophagaceae bacterium]